MKSVHARTYVSTVGIQVFSEVRPANKASKPLDSGHANKQDRNTRVCAAQRPKSGRPCHHLPVTDYSPVRYSLDFHHRVTERKNCCWWSNMLRSCSLPARLARYALSQERLELN